MEKNDKIILTQEGYDKLAEEKEYLISVRRAEVAEHLKYAISQGDLSENADYDAAKDEQAELEERIAKIEEMLRNSVIAEKVDKSVIGVGSTVKIRDAKTKEEFEFTIVGATESDPVNNKISIASPIGERLAGHTANEVVDIEVQGAIIEYKIVSFKN